MKFSLKHAGLFIGAQILLCIALGMATYLLSPKADFLAGSILYIYYPTVYFVWKIAYFTGEANMFMPILLGVPLGMFLYGIILSYFFNYFKTV